MSTEPRTTRAPRVHKFGGAALGSARSLDQVAAIVRAEPIGCAVIVVSAVEGMTDVLERLARRACARDAAWIDDLERFRLRHRSLVAELGLGSELVDPWMDELRFLARELERRGELDGRLRDHLLSIGERLAARLVAELLRQREVPAAVSDAFDLGFLSDSNHGRARPLPSGLDNVRSRLSGALQSGLVPVVTGFIAVDAQGRLTTLGRNGSDLSAALIAAALQARECVFWKSVAGIQVADPRFVGEAELLTQLSYAQAADIARFGARVLHAEALDPLAGAGIPARVAQLGEPLGNGTCIRGEAVAQDLRALVTRRQMSWVRARPDRARAIQAALDGAGLEICLGFEAPLGWLCSSHAGDGRPIKARLGEDAEVVDDLASVAALGASEALDSLRAEFERQRLAPLVCGGVATSSLGPALLFALRERELEFAAQVAHRWLRAQVRLAAKLL